MLAAFGLEYRLSKTQIRAASDYMIQNPDKLSDILDFLLDDNIQIVQNAAWILGKAGQIPSDILAIHFDRIIHILDRPKHPSVTRNIIRILQLTEIPEQYQGLIYDRCFNYIINPNVPTAIRAFSITVCHHIARYHPELKTELQITLKDIYQDGSPGIKSRIKNTLKHL
ncbi:MAG TPA: hypothetical protein PK611_10075 [Saprospiraceae bacterium]|nr:hypothetical protein [Saprospiraceae bacterium]HRO07744.1 hypothetical protein [Saprospiraceae bacterium]HRO74006.1 hypothetical protein [Saprospiraceae bacterium]HRP41030.1 hypothetical protein [Saprospiraceae bacterium]